MIQSRGAMGTVEGCSGYSGGAVGTVEGCSWLVIGRHTFLALHFLRKEMVRI